MARRPARISDDAAPFWKTRTLEEMSASEWESLCDGCGRCCLEKLEDEDSGRIYFTHIGCRLLDGQSCACKDYVNRSAKVPDCVRLTPQNVRGIAWLPPSCAYRLIAEGRDLYWWHPLVSGDPEGLPLERMGGPHRQLAGTISGQGAGQGAEVSGCCVA